ncbi:cobalt-precorrin-6A reductase [Patulibacter defluvii]|uniref:cobalt-precorrin-6A reductase n=1 Tax=Patulibacter defluvii TaxID=3095358 RepID=UPI002A755483|nr:cobalt-precorrin-6A reductase [Patulibacter sp. DM4]
MSDPRPLVLVLGGTAEGRAAAALLDARDDVAVISSLAGRLRDPSAVAGDVRHGGFGGPDELAAWLGERRVAAVIDATHPFAARISHAAAEACRAAAVPLVALRRPGWTAGPGDDWHWVDELAAAAALTPSLGRRALLAIGRQEAAAFAAVADAWFLIRSIEPPDRPLPPRHELLLARGPFALADERALLERHRIDVVVTKDSGGDATRAKLDAARERGIPVVIVRRPPLPPGDATAADPAAAVAEAVARAGG